MNAVSLRSERIRSEDWDASTVAVNAWRGHLIHLFTRAEAAVSETLLALAADTERGESVRRRLLLGQRLGDLAMTLDDAWPFTAEREDAMDALTAFRRHEDIRSLLCHGLAQIWTNRGGDWAVHVELVKFRPAGEERQSRFWTRPQAEVLAKDIARTCRRLETALTRVQTAVAAR